MYKILTVIASLAVLALGVSIVTALLQQSSISHQAKQVATLEAEQKLDHTEIKQLEGRLSVRKTASTNPARIPVILMVVKAGPVSQAFRLHQAVGCGRSAHRHTC